MESAQSETAIITVEVAAALPQRQEIVALRLASGTTLEAALKASGIAEKFPEYDIASCKVGIFGRPAKRDQPLREGDRVELYRPLIADPKEVRRQRAAEGKAMKKGGDEAGPP